MSDIIQVFSERRSVRSYADKPVPDDLLKKVIRESYYSPNAGNKQLLRMVVSRDKDINAYLGKLRHDVMEKFWYPEKGDYKAVTDEELEKSGISNSFYDAPVTVYLFGPKEFEFADGDAYIMANNLCLIARNYDLGSVILSVAVDYFVTDRAKEILKAWNIPDDYVIRAHASIGYPKDGFPDAVPHKKYVAPLFV